MSAKDNAVIRAAAKALASEARVIWDSNVDYFTGRIEDRQIREQHELYILLAKQLRAIAARNR